MFSQYREARFEGVEYESPAEMQEEASRLRRGGIVTASGLGLLVLANNSWCIKNRRKGNSQTNRARSIIITNHWPRQISPKSRLARAKKRH